MHICCRSGSRIGVIASSACRHLHYLNRCLCAEERGKRGRDIVQTNTCTCMYMHLNVSACTKSRSTLALPYVCIIL